MKIIVDPDFPNPQLFVDIIHQVAERFMDRMIHKSILAGKLEKSKCCLPVIRFQHAFMNIY